MITHDQGERAIGLLQDLVSISPATVPSEHGLGVCHYCGEPVRNIHSLLIHHTDGCYWWVAKQFCDELPSEWNGGMGRCG